MATVKKPRVAVTYVFRNVKYRLVEGTEETCIDNRWRKDVELEYSISSDKMGDPIWLFAGADNDAVRGLMYALIDALRLNEPKPQEDVKAEGFGF